MFVPNDFKETRTSENNDLVQKFPLACIVANTTQGLIASHIPLVMKDDQILVGHLAMTNEMRSLIAESEEVLCIFKGPDAYISANYYPSKFVDHKKVPTWNYQAIHIYGKINFFTSNKTKLAAVGMLTKQSEQKANGASGWKMSDAPIDYLMEELAGIIVFEITISRIIAKSKLSQNRDSRDFNSVVKELQARGEHGVAESMLRLDRGQG